MSLDKISTNSQEVKQGNVSQTLTPEEQKLRINKVGIMKIEDQLTDPNLSEDKRASLEVSKKVFERELDKITEAKAKADAERFDVDGGVAFNEALRINRGR